MCYTSNDKQADGSIYKKIKYRSLCCSKKFLFEMDRYIKKIISIIYNYSYRIIYKISRDDFLVCIA